MTYSEDGYEPFIFVKHFKLNNGEEKYIDISEEFVLYFKLYERAENKQNKKYYFIDELGDLDEVINVEPKRIKIKLKYLKEYIAVRQLHRAVQSNLHCADNQVVTKLLLHNQFSNT